MTEISKTGTTGSLRDLSQHNFKELLAFAAISSGCNPLGEAENMVLRTYVIEHYGDWHYDEFKAAFDSYTKDQTQVGFDHRSKLSSRFISAVLKAARIKTNLTKQKALPEAELDKTSWRAKHYNWIIDYSYRHGKIPRTAAWLEAYDHAYYSKLFTISEKQRQEYIIKAEQELTKERGFLQTGNEKRSFDKEKDVKKLCKELFMKDYFKNLMMNEL